MRSIFLAKGGPPLAPPAVCISGRASRRSTSAPTNTSSTPTTGTPPTTGRSARSARTSASTRSTCARSCARSSRTSCTSSTRCSSATTCCARSRTRCPDAAIVYTLHEFLPICHRQGQMLRTTDESPCMQASPRRCNECFPEIEPADVLPAQALRAVALRSSTASSRRASSCAQRYVDWGMPAEKIQVEEYGRTPPPGEAPVTARAPRPLRLLRPADAVQGLQVVLEAARAPPRQGRADPLLARSNAPPRRSRRGDVRRRDQRPHVRMHGANLDLQPGEFQNRIAELLEQARRRCHLRRRLRARRAVRS